MKFLPFELLKEIFKYQEKWWLKPNRQLLNIVPLSQIRKPSPDNNNDATVRDVYLRLSSSRKYVLKKYFCIKNDIDCFCHYLCFLLSFDHVVEEYEI